MSGQSRTTHRGRRRAGVFALALLAALAVGPINQAAADDTSVPSYEGGACGQWWTFPPQILCPGI